MLVHKGTLWYAVESGRERTTLTDNCRDIPKGKNYGK